MVKNAGYMQDFENEFISLTDIACYKSDDLTAVIQNWMRNRDVIEFLGLWKRFYNSDFTPSNSRGLENRLESTIKSAFKHFQMI